MLTDTFSGGNGRFEDVEGTIDWGDGSTSAAVIKETSFDAGASGTRWNYTVETPHRYEAPGQYQVTTALHSGPDTRVTSTKVNAYVKPPPGAYGVTINNGDLFTNSPNVTVNSVWRFGATQVLLANDGSFAAAQSFPIATSIPWRLRSSGPERLPRIVYARFDDHEATTEPTLGSPPRREQVTLTDDIILDETVPFVEMAALVHPRASRARAAAKRYRVRIDAEDSNSGISRLQAVDRRGKLIDTKNVAQQNEFGRERLRNYNWLLRRSRRPVAIRVRDAAGNWTKWRKLRVVR